MPALNFQKQFAPKVELGEKRQTIRAKRKNPVKVGDPLYLYTAQRTKYCRKLRQEVCKKVFNVDIDATGNIYLNGVVLIGNEKERLSKDDGFSCWNEMLMWFENTHGLPFEGQLIVW